MRSNNLGLERLSLLSKLVFEFGDPLHYYLIPQLERHLPFVHRLQAQGLAAFAVLRLAAVFLPLASAIALGSVTITCPYLVVQPPFSPLPWQRKPRLEPAWRAREALWRSWAGLHIFGAPRGCLLSASHLGGWRSWCVSRQENSLWLSA